MDDLPVLHYSPRDIIFKENDFADGVYLILKGKIEISQSDGNKTEILATDGDNCLFGEMALVDNHKRSATVTAIEDTFCYRLKARDFEGKLSRVDKDVRKAYQELALTIRVNNKENSQNLPSWLEYDMTHTHIRTEEEIGHDKELQKKIEKLDPFMKSVFRVLFATAFKHS